MPYLLLASLCLASASFAQDPDPGSGEPEEPSPEPALDPRIEVDRERGEIRFACRFVNPSRVLEVFGCHETGPSHETVVEFSVTGQAIYQALLDIGCRNASWWNGASPIDFERNQGDRLLVLVRWESGGKTREHAAEDMLTDGETGFPAFIRGFSFGARTPAKDAGIPRAVEITLGGTNRQRAVYSVLAHPTSLPRLQQWMLPPYLDPRVVEDHRLLIEKRAPAVLVIRRIRSEADLLGFAKDAAARRGLEERAALYGKLYPVAAEIDGLKAEYQELLGKMRALLDSPLEGLGDAEKKERAEGGRSLLARGQVLSARIAERYLTLYAAEEEHKAAWIERHPEVPVEERTLALLHARDCFSYEPRIAAKEVELAELKAREAAAGDSLRPADRKVLDEALRSEIEALVHHRERRIYEASLKETERRMGDLDAGDTYTRRLFEEESMRYRAHVRMSGAKAVLSNVAARELRAILKDTADPDSAARLAEKAAAQKDLRCAELELKLVEVVEEIRWAEGDAQGPDPERRARGEKILKEMGEKKKEIEKEIAEGCR